MPWPCLRRGRRIAVPLWPLRAPASPQAPRQNELRCAGGVLHTRRTRSQAVPSLPAPHALAGGGERMYFAARSMSLARIGSIRRRAPCHPARQFTGQQLPECHLTASIYFSRAGAAATVPIPARCLFQVRRGQMRGQIFCWPHLDGNGHELGRAIKHPTWTGRPTHRARRCRAAPIPWDKLMSAVYCRPQTAVRDLSRIENAVSTAESAAIHFEVLRASQGVAAYNRRHFIRRLPTDRNRLPGVGQEQRTRVLWPRRQSPRRSCARPPGARFFA
jgi:hypothetical protein